MNEPHEWNGVKEGMKERMTEIEYKKWIEWMDGKDWMHGMNEWNGMNEMK